MNSPVRSWSPGDPSMLWLHAQRGGDSAATGRWHLLALDSLDGHEPALVAAGYNVIGQVLDVSGLTVPERDELGGLLSLPSSERNSGGHGARESDLLQRVPRCTAPGFDLDDGIRRYVVRGPDGAELAAHEVTTADAQAHALDGARRLQAEEAKHGITLRLAWSGGPARAGLHCDRGPADPAARHPLLLRALHERTKVICRAAGVPTSDDLKPQAMTALADTLRAEGWPLRPRRGGRQAAGHRAEAIARYAENKSLVIEVVSGVTPERAGELLDRVRRAVPPVWCDLVPLNRTSEKRGSIFRPLGAHHKTWHPVTAPTARKTLVDPASPPPSPITLAMVAPFLRAAEARQRDEQERPHRARACRGPASPAAVAEARERRTPGAAQGGRDLIYRDALPVELAALIDVYAETHGPAFVGCGARHDAGLGVSGVLGREGIAADLVGDLGYLLALAGGMSEHDATARAADLERAARGVLDGRPAGGLGIVRDAMGDDAANDLADLALRLAGAEGRELLRALPGLRALDPGATGRRDVIEAFAWAREHDPETHDWLKDALAGSGVWRDLERRAKKVRAEQRDRAGGDGVDDVRYFEADGSTFARRETAEGTKVIKLANFTARIAADIERDDGSGETARMFVIEVEAGAREIPPFRVLASQFAAMNWVPEHAGAEAIIEPTGGARELLRHAIQIRSAPIPRRRVYAHLGWREVDAGWVYLHAGGAIGAAGPVAGVDVSLDGTLARYVLPTPPDGQRLIDAIRASLRMLDVAPLAVTLPVWAAVWRAPLGEAHLSVFVDGRTGLGKSCVCALGQQHYGAGMHFHALPGSWESTANALEGIAFAAKDAVLVVDDFVPRGSQVDRHRLHATADRLFRAQGNGAGRQRMRDNLSLRAERPPRGIVVSTGEELPAGASCQARMLVATIRKGDIDLAKLTAAQADADAGLYAEAMAAYLRWLAPQVDAIRSTLRAEVAAMRGEFARDDVHGRTPDAAADLFAGVRQFARFAREAGALTSREADELIERTHAALLALVGAQAAGQREADPLNRFIDLLGAALAGGRAHLVGPGGAIPGGSSPVPNVTALGWRRMGEGTDAYAWAPRGEQVGWIEGDDAYLLPSAAIATVRRAAEATGETWATSERRLGEMLADRGMLRSRRKGRNTSYLPSRLAGDRANVYHLPAAMLGLTGGDGPEPEACHEPEPAAPETGAGR